jgi:hypothetical protein
LGDKFTREDSERNGNLGNEKLNKSNFRNLLKNIIKRLDEAKERIMRD